VSLWLFSSPTTRLTTTTRRLRPWVQANGHGDRTENKTGII